MADNYLKISSDNGSVNISENVIAVIASAALNEVDGFAGLANVSGSDISGIVGKKTASKGVRISFEDDITSLDVCISVKYGKKIADVALDAQNAVTSAVESMTGVRPVVNVHVSGIILDK